MKKEKKIYEQPKIKRVRLIPEEAILGFCKNDVSAGPGQSQCLIPQCFNQGS